LYKTVYCVEIKRWYDELSNKKGAVKFNFVFGNKKWEEVEFMRPTNISFLLDDKLKNLAEKKRGYVLKRIFYKRTLLEGYKLMLKDDLWDLYPVRRGFIVNLRLTPEESKKFGAIETDLMIDYGYTLRDLRTTALYLALTRDEVINRYE